MADIRDDFNARIERITESGCWIWMGGTTVAGYGLLRKQYAHRLSWTFFRGPIPEGLWVLHRCDIPACVNPAHLFVGTNKTNMDDKVAKGRHARGETGPKPKLRDEDVYAILASSEPGYVLAAKYGVSEALISGIRRGYKWAHLPRPESVKVRRVGRAREEKKRLASANRSAD